MSTCLSFADDFTVIKPISDDNSMSELQDDINLISRAYSSLRLTLNPNKCKVMYFSLAPAPILPTSALFLAGEPLPVTDSLKYLGVTLDRKLSFDLHTSLVTVKLKQALGAIHRSAGLFCSSSIMKKLFTGKILPLLCYCLAMVPPTSKYAWLALEKVNRFGLRLMFNDYNSPYDQLLVKAGASSVAFRYFKLSLRLGFKYVYGLRHYPLGICLKLPPVRVLRQANHSLQIQIPDFVKLRISSCLQFPIFRLFRIWNTLPTNCDAEMTDLDSLPVFMRSFSSKAVFDSLAAKLPNDFHVFCDL